MTTRWREFLARFDGIPSPAAISLAAACPPHVAAEQTHPRLRVWSIPYLVETGRGAWRREWRYQWRVTGPHGEILDQGDGSHPQALAVGLAALEAATAAR